MNNYKTILIVDDEEPIRKLLKTRFEREGYTVRTAESGDDAIIELKKDSNICVVVSDVKMPGMTGIELTTRIKSDGKHAPKVIVMTGHGEKSTAIEALRIGASDYREKPFDLEEMVYSVTRTVNEYRLERENEEFVNRLQDRVARVEGKESDQFWYVSKSRVMEPVNEWLKVLQRESMRGNTDEPTTLILGESGTGKEGVARMIHASSRRAKGAWIAINCANFSETLLESELFGHEKGAFTGASSQKRGLFELASNGTLFLDEIGEMDGKLQAKILRVLQEGTFRRVGGNTDIKADIRLLAATNQNLLKLIETGKFREDLYHRLARVVINIPALRERSEDIVPMSTKFFESSFAKRGKKFEGFTQQAESALSHYPWPGNVRELLNVVERTALLWNQTGAVDVIHLSLPAGKYKQMGGAAVQEFRPGLTLDPESFSFGEASMENYTQLKKRWSDSFEKEYLMHVLERNNGNVTAAAKESGIDRSNFLRLLRRHGVSAQNYRGAKSAA
ncbi:MAG: sigma-54-dependent Fis family transcriptional regulator [Bdellovibrionales bacterium]|nr:sigma-54-dependent Fis family transcriptional regulator [Bdellovibrionales bacterium]